MPNLLLRTIPVHIVYLTNAVHQPLPRLAALVLLAALLAGGGEHGVHRHQPPQPDNRVQNQQHPHPVRLLSLFSTRWARTAEWVVKIHHWDKIAFGDWPITKCNTTSNVDQLLSVLLKQWNKWKRYLFVSTLQEDLIKSLSYVMFSLRGTRDLAGHVVTAWSAEFNCESLVPNRFCSGHCSRLSLVWDVRSKFYRIWRRICEASVPKIDYWSQDFGFGFFSTVPGLL